MPIMDFPSISPIRTRFIQDGIVVSALVSQAMMKSIFGLCLDGLHENMSGPRDNAVMLIPADFKNSRRLLLFIPQRPRLKKSSCCNTRMFTQIQADESAVAVGFIFLSGVK